MHHIAYIYIFIDIYESQISMSQNFESSDQWTQDESLQHYVTKFIDHAVKFYEAMHNGDCRNLERHWAWLTIYKSKKHFQPVLHNNQNNELAKFVVSDIRAILRYLRMKIPDTLNPDQLLRTLPTVEIVAKNNSNIMLTTNRGRWVIVMRWMGYQ